VGPGQVEIDGVQYGATERLRDAIQVDIVAVEDSVQIRAIRPLESHGNLGVRFVIKAPEGLTWTDCDLERAYKADDIEGVMRVRTSNGQVQAARVRGDLDVQTSNGSIDLRAVDGRRTSGRATVRSMPTFARVAGHDLERRHLCANAYPEPRRPMRLSTSNGGIELTMDSLKDNDVRATTSNGGITLSCRPPSARAFTPALPELDSYGFDVRRDDRDSRITWTA